MKGDFDVRFRENVGVQFPCVTRLVVSQKQHPCSYVNLADKKVAILNGNDTKTEQEQEQRTANTAFKQLGRDVGAMGNGS